MTKTILITGATAGFGAAAARQFAGGRLAGDRHRPPRAIGCASWRKNLASVPAAEIDMRDRDAVEAWRKLSPPWGDVDLLLNNAGLAPPMTPMQDADRDRIQEVIDTNITGLVALTRALLPTLI